MFGFRWIGGLIDCALGKNRKIIDEQSININNHKSHIYKQNKKIIKLEANEEANRDLADRWFMKYQEVKEELNQERLANIELNIAKQEIFLEAERISDDQDDEAKKRKEAKKKKQDTADKLAQELKDKIEKRNKDKLNK